MMPQRSNLPSIDSVRGQKTFASRALSEFNDHVKAHPQSPRSPEHLTIDCTVADTGYPIKSSSTPCRGVWVSVNGTSGTPRWGSTASAPSAANGGAIIPVDDGYFVEITDAADLQVASTTGGDDVGCVIMFD